MISYGGASRRFGWFSFTRRLRHFQISTNFATRPNGYNFSYNPFGSFEDLALGDNNTANGDGVARFSNDFFGWLGGNIPSDYNVAQESENIGFGTFGNSDPQALGLYTVSLTVSDGGNEVLSNNININVAPIPVPAALPLLLAGLGGLGLVARRKRKAA